MATDSEMWVEQLTNDELFQKLFEFGANPGPVVDSTRRVYERKLIDLTQQMERGEPTVRAQPSQPRQAPSYAGENSAQPPSSSEDEEVVIPSVARQPSPARPGSSYGRRLVMSEQSYTTTSHRSSTLDDSSPAGLMRRPLRDNKAAAPAAASTAGAANKASSGGFSLGIKLLLVLLLLGFLYLVYMNFESSPDDPLKTIEDV